MGDDDLMAIRTIEDLTSESPYGAVSQPNLGRLVSLATLRHEVGQVVRDEHMRSRAEGGREHAAIFGVLERQIRRPAEDQVRVQLFRAGLHRVDDRTAELLTLLRG